MSRFAKRLGLRLSPPLLLGIGALGWGAYTGRSPWVENTLADPFPADAQTVVVQTLRSPADVDFVGGYAILSDPEKEELGQLLSTELATFRLGAGLSTLGRELGSSGSELIAWGQAPFTPDGDPFVAKSLQDKPRRYSILFAKGECARPGQGIAISRPATQNLAKKDAFPKAPRDAAKTCERLIRISLQGDWGNTVRLEELQAVPARQMSDFLQGPEAGALFKRAWLLAERWETEDTKATNFAQRLRVIEVLAGEFSEARFAKRKAMVAYLSSGEARGARNADACTLLGQFYATLPIPPADSERGACVSPGGAVATRLPANVTLPAIPANAAVPGEMRAYLDSLRGAYSTALDKVRSEKIGTSAEYLDTAALLGQQIATLQFSVHAAHLFAEYRREAGDFDYDGEAVRLLRQRVRQPRPAAIAGTAAFERAALQATADNLKRLRAILGAAADRELAVHEKIVDALLKRLSFL